MYYQVSPGYLVRNELPVAYNGAYIPFPYYHEDGFDIFPNGVKSELADAASRLQPIKRIPDITYRRREATWVVILPPELGDTLKSYKYLNAKKIGFFRAYVEALSYKYMAVNPLLPNRPFADIQNARLNLPKFDNIYLRHSDLHWVYVKLIDGVKYYRTFDIRVGGVVASLFRTVAYSLSVAAEEKSTREKVTLQERKNPDTWLDIGTSIYNYFIDNVQHSAWMKKQCAFPITEKAFSGVAADIRDIFSQLDTAYHMDTFENGGGMGYITGPYSPKDKLEETPTAVTNGPGHLRLAAIMESVYTARDNRAFGVPVAANVKHFPQVPGLSFDYITECWVDETRVFGSPHIWEASRWGFVGAYKAAVAHQLVGTLAERVQEWESVEEKYEAENRPGKKRRCAN